MAARGTRARDPASHSALARVGSEEGQTQGSKESPPGSKGSPPGSKESPRQSTVGPAPAGHKEGGASHSALARVGSGAGAVIGSKGSPQRI
jgi:hypothetical protein